MKYAIVAPVAAGVTADAARMAAFARHVEACGFESIVVVEHTVLMARYASVYPYDESGRVELAADCPVPDPLDLLAFLAGQTTSLGLATGVLVLPNHHPVVLAKRVATLDALSGGRVRLCVGVGWLKEEIDACGGQFASRGGAPTSSSRSCARCGRTGPTARAFTASSSTSTTPCAIPNRWPVRGCRSTSAGTAGPPHAAPGGSVTGFSHSVSAGPG